MNKTSNAQLADMIGVTNLDLIKDYPEALDCHIREMHNRIGHQGLRCPLRVKVACQEYIARATQMLENPGA